MKRTLFEFVLPAAALLVAGFLAIKWIGRNDAPAPNAVRACQDAVTDQLKSPATAIFPEPTGEQEPERFETTGAMIWTSYVDSENGFGALIRTDFVCNVDGNGTATAQLFSR